MMDRKKIEIEKIERQDKGYEYEMFKFFDVMCEQAKLLFLKALCNRTENKNDLECLTNTMMYHYDKAKGKRLSPIEQIFLVAFIIYDAWYLIGNNKYVRMAIDWALKEQHLIQYKDKKYIADFAIDFNLIDEDDEEYLLDKTYLRKHKYVIELDGHDYHKTKQQMSADYERENNLKELGYSVIRFTGSQVYNNPLSCVDKMITIIANDIDKDGEQDG